MDRYTVKKSKYCAPTETDLPVRTIKGPMILKFAPHASHVRLEGFFNVNLPLISIQLIADLV